MYYISPGGPSLPFTPGIPFLPRTPFAPGRPFIPISPGDPGFPLPYKCCYIHAHSSNLEFSH